jgi:beta-mannosidase
MTGRILLDRWRIRDVDPGAGEPATSAAGWMDVAAPGDVYQALVAAGRLEHPFEKRNEADAAWVRDREWWWRTAFTAPDWNDDEHTITLVLEGLDTFAEVFLDEVSLGRADNMFHSWRYDLSGHVTPGATHQLAIRFDPTAKAIARPALPAWSSFSDRISRSQRNLMRKAQFGWGWDWGPDLPTVGVWRPAAIEVRSRARIAGVRFSTIRADEAHAEAVVHVELSRAASGLPVDIRLTDPDGGVAFEHIGPAGDPVTIALDHPRLWWTADQGDQPLYALSVRLGDGDQVLDAVEQRVGLRTLVLDQSPDPDEPGANFFRFVLNGRPIFAKGACWVPPTSFLADVDAEAYRRLVTQAVDANMNMIRVWGGGVYEPDLFHDLCDEKGVLVWQDFMFACAPYPEDAAFVASVGREVDEQVRRLRNHASMALWCGNNENQAIHRIHADVSGEDAPLAGAVLYEQVIPERLARLDPATPYWPGSPWGGPHPNSMMAGDIHDWTVWHGIPPIPNDRMAEPFGFAPEKIGYERYAEDTGRFISEFGIQAAPALATLRRWMDPADLEPESEGFHQRIKDEARKALAMIGPVTGVPATIQDYVDFTQWTQAEGLKFGIEHFRRRRPHCSGALIWQFNDCWPCVSWSLVDYDGVEKAAYYAVRRAFAPVLASFETREDQAALWISNDLPGRIRGDVTVALASLDGDVAWRRVAAYDVRPGEHAVVWRGAAPRAPGHFLRAWSETGAFAPNRLFGGPLRDLPLAYGRGPDVRTERISDTELRMALSADACLPFVYVISDRTDLRFSDNYFDLAAGESRAITIDADAPLAPPDVSVRCWNLREVWPS